MKSETFRFQVGSFSCIAIQDDAPVYPIGMFLTNVVKEQYEPQLIERGESAQYTEIPYTCLLINTGRERLLVDTGVGVDSARPAQGDCYLCFVPKGLSLTRSRRSFFPTGILTI
jgi:hypothetical protein